MTPTCATCHTSFTPNHELASLPHGRSIAFDAELERVWRICTKCGEWNLLGPEAAAAALPELSARMAASPAQTRDGVTVAPVSATLSMLELGGTRKADDLRVREHRRVIDRRARIAMVLLGITVLLLVLSWQKRDITMMWLLKMVVGGAWLMSWVLFARTGWAALNGFTAQWKTAVASGAVFLITTVAQTQFAPGLITWFAMIFTLGPVGVMAAWIRIPVWVLTEGTHAVRLNDYELLRVSLDWNQATGELALHDLPNGEVVAGEKAELVLRRILAKVPSKRKLADGERGEALWRAVGGRTGLLAALEGFRRDQDGRVVIADLPVVYRTALELEVAPDASLERHRKVLAGLPAASEVAAIAESLDAPRLKPRLGDKS